MEILIGLVGVLAGWLFFERNRRKSAEALNHNLETKEELLEKDKEISNNNASLALEEKRREDLNKQTGNKDETVKDVLDFLNKLDSNSGK